MRWRTANRFAAPIVVRMPGGFGKDVGDPWHSLSDEVRLAHAVRLAGGDAVERRGRGRTAARGDAQRQPDDLLRASLAADDQRRQRALSRRRLRACRSARATVVREGTDVTVVTLGRAGASLRRGGRAVRRRGRAHRSAHDRAVGPRRRCSRRCAKTGRCVIVHEDNLTAGFGAEIAATRRARRRSGTSMRRSTASRSRTFRCRTIRSCSMRCLPSVELIAARIEATLRS